MRKNLIMISVGFLLFIGLTSISTGDENRHICTSMECCENYFTIAPEMLMSEIEKPLELEEWMLDTNLFGN